MDKKCLLETSIPTWEHTWLDPLWLELNRFLANKFPVIVKVQTHSMPDPAHQCSVCFPAVCGTRNPKRVLVSLEDMAESTRGLKEK